MPDEPRRDLAVPPGAEVAEAVIDGAIVNQAAAVPGPGGTAAHPLPGMLLRHSGYVAAGVAVAVKRRHLARTRHERVLRALEAQGNHEAMLAWRQQRVAEQAERRERRQQRVEAAVAIAPLVPWILLAAAVAPGLLGICLAFDEHDPLVAIEPYMWVAHAVGTAWSVMSAVWFAAIFAVPVGILARLHHLGRTAGDGPRWLATSADSDIDVSIDEVTITQALANLRIPQVRDYLKQGLPLQFIVPCRQEGRGTYAEVRLPGVPAEKVARRRPDLAAGVHRMAKEVFPSVGSEAAILKLWIADQGALEEGAGPYPLLEEGFTDVFKGLPWGRTLKGDPSRHPVIGRNSIDGGMPEQGKSNGARVVACGYTLDITTELRIYVPDMNFDFEGFKPRCSRYLMGAEDEVIERMLEEQELLKDELQRRGQLLIDHEAQEVTRELAHAGVGLHPVLVLIEEAHVPITHGKYGKDFGRLLGENVKLDRKRGVHIKVSTQAPVRGAMPRDVTTNCTVGIAYALADIYANDAILGPGAHSAGHRATELIPAVDRGTALCKGFGSEARSEMVQAYRVNTGQVPPIVDRALAEMARRGRELPGSGLPVLESRDLLADLAEVARDDAEPARLSDLPARLRKLAPSWGAYKSLTGVQLRGELTGLGVRTTNTANVPRLDPADLRRVLAEREEDGAHG